MFQDIRIKFSIAGELIAFLWKRKVFWLMPVAFVLLFLGLLIAIGSSTGVGPFIYTLF